MKLSNFAKSALFSAITIVGAGFTAAFGSASQSITLQGEVPLICRVSLAGGSADFDAAGRANLGQASEFCNSSNGYRVYARAEGEVDGASILVDGSRFPLEAGVEFLVASSNTPNVVNRSIVYDAGDTDGGGRLSLRIAAN
jgi:hypothetical protein